MENNPSNTVSHVVDYVEAPPKKSSPPSAVAISAELLPAEQQSSTEEEALSEPMDGQTSTPLSVDESIEREKLELEAAVFAKAFSPIVSLSRWLWAKTSVALPATATAVLSLAIGVLIWHWASTVNFNWFINFENVPTPGKVFSAFLAHMQTEVFYIHIGVSMRRILISYSLAVVIGILVGVMMGRSLWVRRFLMPYIEVVRPIPAVAWIPLAILMWPTEESSIIYITFLGALFPIVLNTLHGVEQTPGVLVKAAQSLGASRFGIFWHVVLPGALPSIAAGLAIGMGVSWFSLLAGEIISGQYGIGYFTWDAYSLINYQDIVVGMLVIGFLGTLSTAAVRLMTRPMLKWQRRARTT